MKIYLAAALLMVIGGVTLIFKALDQVYLNPEFNINREVARFVGGFLIGAVGIAVLLVKLWIVA